MSCRLSKVTPQAFSLLQTSLVVEERGSYPLACLCGLGRVTWPLWASVSPSGRWGRGDKLSLSSFLAWLFGDFLVITYVDMQNSLCQQALPSS